MQTRIASLMEALANIGIGMVLSFITQILVFPLFGIEISTQSNLLILMIFTLVSLVRSYVIRRWFNGGFKFKHRVVGVESCPHKLNPVLLDRFNIRSHDEYVMSVKIMDILNKNK